MNFFRYFLGFCLILLLISARDAGVSPADGRGRDARAKFAFERTPLEDRNYVYYTVQPGDTLDSIERKFRIGSEESVLAINESLNPNHLKANQRIKIPLQ